MAGCEVKGSSILSMPMKITYVWWLKRWESGLMDRCEQGSGAVPLLSRMRLKRST